MNSYKILGLAIGASLLFVYGPAVKAAPMPASPSAVSNSDGFVVQIKKEQRTERQSNRQGNRSERQGGRHERRESRH